MDWTTPVTHTATDYYNYDDLNRVEDNTYYLADYIETFAARPIITTDITNLLVNPELNIDLDSNGLADDWSASSTSCTAVRTIDSDAQKIEITSSSSASAYSQVTQFVLNISPGNVLFGQVYAKISGNVRAKLIFNWYNGSTYIGQSTSSYYTSTDFGLISLSATAPANTTKVNVVLIVGVISSGAVGSGWFKNALFLNLSVWDNTDIPNFDDLNRIEGNILAIKTAIGEPVGWLTPKTDWVSVVDNFGYIQANRLETNLLALKDLAEQISTGLLYCGDSLTTVCGKGNTLF